MIPVKFFIFFLFNKLIKTKFYNNTGLKAGNISIIKLQGGKILHKKNCLNIEAV